MSPSPLRKHNAAVRSVLLQLDGQVPDDLMALCGLDVDLELATPDKQGFVRRTDLLVVQRGPGKRKDAEGGLIRATVL